MVVREGLLLVRKQCSEDSEVEQIISDNLLEPEPSKLRKRPQRQRMSLTDTDADSSFSFCSEDDDEGQFIRSSFNSSCKNKSVRMSEESS